MATQLATVDETRAAVASLNNQLATRADQFKMVLPAHIRPDQFQRTIITAVQSDPDLLKADRQSLLLACMKAAQDGLLPDKREAALVIFSTRVKQGTQWVSIKQVQYMPMVYGLRKKILQSGEISSIETNVVYKREFEEGAFIYEAGTEAVLRHRPMLDLTDEESADDQIIAAYSVAVMKDGTKSFEVMRRSEINKVRQVSQTGALGKTKYNSSEPVPPKGPWVDWFGEMARKTVMRRHAKTLPMSGDLIDVEGADEDIAARSVAASLASDTPEPPRLVQPSRDDAGEETTHDPETGEVLDEDAERALDAEIEARNNGTLSDDNPSAAKGPADEQRGEATGEDPGDSASHLLGKIKRCETIVDLTKITDAWFAGDRELFDEADQKTIEATMDAVSAKLKKQARA